MFTTSISPDWGERPQTDGREDVFTQVLWGASHTLAHLVYPQLPHDDVVHGGGDFLPRVVIVALLKNGVNGAWQGRKGGSDLVNGLMKPETPQQSV